jgi:hypothetical protein
MSSMGKGEVLVPFASFFDVVPLALGWLWRGGKQTARQRSDLCTRWTAGFAGLILSVRFLIYCASLSHVMA